MLVSSIGTQVRFLSRCKINVIQYIVCSSLPAPRVQELVVLGILDWQWPLFNVVSPKFVLSTAELTSQ